VTKRALFLFAALGIAWGIPYLLIKIAVGEVSPAVVVFGRSLIGAVLLLPLAIYRKQVLVVLKRWPLLLIFTAVEIVIPWIFLSTAEQHLPSSTAGLLLAAVPLVGVPVAFLFGRPARLTWSNWVGIALGMLGVAALVGLDVAGSELVGVVLLIAVVVGYAIGPVIQSRWMADLPSIGVVALALGVAAIANIPIVLFSGGFPAAWPSTPAIVSIVLLGAVCSALALVLMFALVAEVGPMRMTTVTYLNPAVAIIAGALVLGEEITIWTVIGFVLVIGGSFLVNRKRKEPLLPPDPAAAPVIEEQR
jgi:drug/metabolite transporter (DMT)-like permease